MKILIISDTHGAHRNFDRVIEKEQPLDMLIHLGDVEGDEDYIPAVADCPVHMVRGNNDFFSGLEGEEEFMIGGYHIFITHGHGYYVSMGEERLKQEARGRGADIAMYGHTHRPFYEKEKDVTLKSVLKKIDCGSCNIAVIIGPEGGLDECEVKKLVGQGAISVTLGKRILRTETAPVAMSAIIMYELGS